MTKNRFKSKIKHWITLVFAAILLVQCTSSSTKKFVKEPLDAIIKENSKYQNFSIILYDMDYDQSNKSYKHQYQILVEPLPPEDTTLVETITTWKVVSDAFFNKHVEDMGMEIAFKKDGKLEKKTAPPGYSNYVGNKKYGHWNTNSSGNSFWAFYGRYAFMSSMFRMASYPIYRSHYNNYHSNYYGSGRSYYGPRTSSGGNTYGTSSSYNKARTTSTWNNKSSSFKSNVRSNVSRSASTSKRKSRSSSRYKGSNSRSRSGGYGK